MFVNRANGKCQATMDRHRIRNTCLSILILLLIFTSTTIIAAESTVTKEGDWIVTCAETVRGKHIRLNGNLILEPNAVLTMEDCNLEILGTRSREHFVDWKGGTLITRNSTLGGFVNENGTPIHTVFH